MNVSFFLLWKIHLTLGQNTLRIRTTMFLWNDTLENKVHCAFPRATSITCNVNAPDSNRPCTHHTINSLNKQPSSTYYLYKMKSNILTHTHTAMFCIQIVIKQLQCTFVQVYILKTFLNIICIQSKNACSDKCFK